LSFAKVETNDVCCLGALVFDLLISRLCYISASDLRYFFYFTNQYRQMVGDSLPYNGFINNVISMYQDISESYDAVMFGNFSQQFIIRIFNPVKNLPDNLEIPFNSSLCNMTVPVCLEIHATNKILYFFGCLKDINEVFACFIVHK